MTSTTPEKAYCMKCDVLIHVPSGIAYTGRAEEDRFIGSQAILLGEERQNSEATLTPNALILTWKDGEEFRHERIGYAAITGVEVGQRRADEIFSREMIESSTIWGGEVSPEMSYGGVPTLRIHTQERDYEVYGHEPQLWANRLRGLTTTATPIEHEVTPAKAAGIESGPRASISVADLNPSFQSESRSLSATNILLVVCLIAAIIFFSYVGSFARSSFYGIGQGLAWALTLIPFIIIIFFFIFGLRRRKSSR